MTYYHPKTFDLTKKKKNRFRQNSINLLTVNTKNIRKILDIKIVRSFLGIIDDMDRIFFS